MSTFLRPPLIFTFVIVPDSIAWLAAKQGVGLTLKYLTSLVILALSQWNG